MIIRPIPPYGISGIRPAIMPSEQWEYIDKEIKCKFNGTTIHILESFRVSKVDGSCEKLSECTIACDTLMVSERKLRKLLDGKVNEELFCNFLSGVYHSHKLRHYDRIFSSLVASGISFVRIINLRDYGIARYEVMQTEEWFKAT